MRLSQVLVIAVASFLFASDTAAVATSNQVKVSKMAESNPSQRLLRSHKYLVEEEEDQSEDSMDDEKRGFATRDEEDLEERSPLSSATVKKLEKIAEEKAKALLALRDAYVSGDRSAKQAAKMALLRANKS